MSVAQRLARVMHDGNLTLADLTRLFDRPYATVRGWLHGHAVGGAALDAAFIEARIAQLEKAIKKGGALPVPRLGRKERAAYIAKLR